VHQAKQKLDYLYLLIDVLVDIAVRDMLSHITHNNKEQATKYWPKTLMQRVKKQPRLDFCIAADHHLPAALPAIIQINNASLQCQTTT
jgi:hypothetical protein